MNKILILTALIFGLYAFITNDSPNESPEYVIRKSKVINTTDPPSIQVYMAIEKYTDSFNIPKRYAYGVANTETGYRGPFHFSYNHKQTSSASAVGPMQIMLATARGLNKDGVSRTKLMGNIEYNVMTSMKLLRRLKDMRGRWELVFGEYNTGRTIVNGYSHKVMNYKYNWK